MKASESCWCEEIRVNSTVSDCACADAGILHMRMVSSIATASADVVTCCFTYERCSIDVKIGL